MKDWEDFELEEWDIDEDIVDVSTLSVMELLDIYEEQGEILKALGEVLNPTSQAGRDAHSLYGACKVELKQRGIL